MTRYLLVVGAQRCGTTYLYQVLDEHPEIAMAKPARPEPKFFFDAEKYRRGLTWYEANYFAGAEGVPVHGEKSTTYIESPVAAERAAAMIPNADVLVMLRDPIDRAISNWRFSSASGLEDRPLGQALAENLQGPRSWDPTSISVSPFAYLERGRYAAYLESWRQSFGQRMHVLFLEEFAGNPEALACLYRSVGVASAFLPPSLNARINVGEAPTTTIEPSLARSLRLYFEESDELLRAELGGKLPWDRLAEGQP
ncbi:MAG: sulfotransferase family protein [Actinomycetota bacterium]